VEWGGINKREKGDKRSERNTEIGRGGRGKREDRKGAGTKTGKQERKRKR